MTKTLEQLRAEAYAAFNAHQHDVKTDATYRSIARKEAQKQIKKAVRKYGVQQINAIATRD